MALRVLLTDPWGAGGISVFVETLTSELHQRGADVEVFCWQGASSPAERYLRAGAKAVRAGSFRHVVQRGHYDIVHITENELSRPFEVKRQMQRVGSSAKLVLTVHQETAVLDSVPDSVVFLSEQAQAASSLAGSPQVSVIPNGVRPTRPPDTQAPRSYTQPIALWSGRVEDEPLRQKDFSGFLAAISLLLSDRWAVLVLDGSSPHPEYPVEELLRTWFGEDVRYINRAEPHQVAEVLNAVRESGGAMVSTSRSEAFPYAVLEALASGVPVLLPNIPTLQRIFVDRGLARGYDRSPRALAEGMRELRFTTPPELPEEYSASQMGLSYHSLYGHLLGGRSSKGPTILQLAWRAYTEFRARAGI